MKVNLTICTSRQLILRNCHSAIATPRDDFLIIMLGIF